MKRNKKEDTLLNTENEEIAMFANIEPVPQEDETKFDFDTDFPILPLRNMVMFPFVVMPITVGRPSTLKLVNAAFKKKQPVAIFCQVQAETEKPGFDDLHQIGVIGKILRIFEMPGGNTTVIMQSNGPKVHLECINKTTPYLKGRVSPIPEKITLPDNDEATTLLETCRELTQKFIETSERMSPDTAFAIKNLEMPEMLISFIGSNFPFSVEDKMTMLKTDTLMERIYALVKILNREVKLAEIRQHIQQRTREDIDR